MKSYFYSLLARYISCYIQPDNTMVEINPQHELLIELLNVHKKMVCFSAEKTFTCVADYVKGCHSIKEFNPDYILLNGNLHYEKDIQQLLETLRMNCSCETRLIAVYYNNLWRPVVNMATRLGIRHKTPEQNWIAHEDIETLYKLAGLELVQRSHHIIVPLYIPILSTLFNQYLSYLPGFRLLSMITVVVARPILEKNRKRNMSVSIVIPARNESGNIESIIQRLPQMGPNDEVIFVEGGSKDATWEMIKSVAEKYQGIRTIRYVRQDGKGKGDAVRKGFSMASNDILMILDADISVAPEELPKFYKAIMEDKGELIIGSRLVYPMRPGAMRFLNILGNKFFASAFSFLLGQRFKDTLCGTKVLTRENYAKITKHRKYFGDFDPFGDFDLIFGASRCGMKILEIPIPYYERMYGQTNIKRWRHGFLLFEMLFFAARKIKFI